MKGKKLFLTTMLTMLMPLGMMATTLITDPVTGLKWLDDGNDVAYDATNSSRYYIIIGQYSGQSQIVTDPTTGNSVTVTARTFVTQNHFVNWIQNNFGGKITKSGNKWYITKANLESITTLNMSGSTSSWCGNGTAEPGTGSVGSTGIEYFSNITTLSVTNSCNNSSGSAISLDLSMFANLTSLTITGATKISTLTLPSAAPLVTLNLSGNTGMALSNPSAIEGYTQLTTLNVSGVTGISSLDLSSCTSLTSVTFDNTNLEFGNTLKVPDGDWEKTTTSGTTETWQIADPLTITELTRDVTKGQSTDVSGYPSLKKLTLIGADENTVVTLPSNRVEFTIDATESPTWLADFSSQASTLKKLYCIGVCSLKVAGCNELKLNKDGYGLANNGLSQSKKSLKYLDISNCTGLGQGEHEQHFLQLDDFTALEYLKADGCSYIRSIQAKNAKLTNENIHVTNCTSLTSIVVHRNRLNSLTFLDQVLHQLEILQANGGANQETGDSITEPTNAIKEIKHEDLPTTLETLMLRHNLLEKLSLTSDQSSIKSLELRNNRLWALNLEELQNLDEVFNVTDQRTYAQAKVIKSAGGDELRLYLPPGSEDLNYGNMSDFVLTANDKSYSTYSLGNDGDGGYIQIPIYADEADLNLPEEAEVTYMYDTKARGAKVDVAEDGSKMKVTIELDPYIMYMNPDTRTPKNAKISKTDLVDYYSGTLYLDYDAYVPKGVTVWIPTAIKESRSRIETGGTTEAFNQLFFEQIGSEGDIIPAGTAMYVRADYNGNAGAVKGSGLYDFRRVAVRDYIGWLGKADKEYLAYNWELPETISKAEIDAKKADILSKNLLTGTIGGTDVDARSVLTLGREKKKNTGLIGFWPYNGTKIKPHRCYITEYDYDHAPILRDNGNNSGATSAEGAKGASFFFAGIDDKVNDDPIVVTEIKTVEQSQVAAERKGWYTLQGVRLNARPTASGIYIHDGKTEIVK